MPKEKWTGKAGLEKSTNLVIAKYEYECVKNPQLRSIFFVAIDTPSRVAVIYSL